MEEKEKKPGFDSLNRREFLRYAGHLSASALLVYREGLLFSHCQNKNIRAQDRESQTRRIFFMILQQAEREGWADLPIGECMGKIGQLLVGTEYVAGSLEGEGPEVCRVNLTGLDCVTFFENVLCLARILKKGKTAFDDFLAEVTFTRYRGGRLTDYTSRLHYTSDWIDDNVKKSVVRNITEEIGGEEFSVQVSFMSKNPEYYPALAANSSFIQVIAEQEQAINRRKHWFIPQKRIKKALKHLQTGDIIALATRKKGLDYGHTGLILCDQRGKVRLLHASAKEKKVFWDKELDRYVRSVDAHTGITVARPLEINKKRQSRA